MRASVTLSHARFEFECDEKAASIRMELFGSAANIEVRALTGADGVPPACVDAVSRQAGASEGAPPPKVIDFLKAARERLGMSSYHVREALSSHYRVHIACNADIPLTPESWNALVAAQELGLG
ncbi:MAG: hypothetical protein L0177_02580 [Chloroflexi bacterium]|nr:hypothetical protein [Chloroflexota bacterium]